MTTSTLRSLLAAAALVASAVAIGAAGRPGPGDVPLFSAPAALAADAIPDVLLGPGAGAQLTKLLSGADSTVLASGYPFGPAFAGGVRVASGDVDGDGIPDAVVATGPGGGMVRVYRGSDIGLLFQGQPFGPAFTGGLFVAVADIDHDGLGDILVAPGQGGGEIRAYRGTDAGLIGAAAPFGAAYAGGLRLAAGDVTGDGVDDIVAAQASGNLVTIIDGATYAPLVTTPVPGPAAGGLYVATGDITGDGVADVIVAPGSGNEPVLLFDVRTASVIGSLAPYEPGFTGGVRVAAADLNGDGRAEIITAPGPGGAPLLRVFDGATLAPLASTLAYDASFTGGVFLAAIDIAHVTLPRFTSPAAATFTVGTAGSLTVTTAGRPAVTTIAAGGPLPAGLAFTDRGNGTATIAGTPAAGSGGATTVTLTATSSAGSATQALVVTIHEAPAITSAATTAFTAGTAGSFAVTTTGFPRPAVAHSGALPAGVTFVDNGDGTAQLSGTPPAGSGGAFPIVLTAANGIGANAAQSFTLNVTSNCPTIVVAPTVLPGGMLSTAYGPVTFTQTGTTDPVTWSASGTLPPGLLLSGGVLSGTPTQQGTYTFTVTAATASGCSGSATVNLTVAAANQAPTVAAATIAYDVIGNTQLHVAGATRPGVTALVDAAGVLAKSGAADADGPGPLATVPQADAATAHGRVTVDADGSFTYVPDAGYTGADSFVAQVTDSALTVDVTVDLTVASRVWYVNNHTDANNPSGGDGRSTDAFETLAAADGAAGENDIIFVFAGDTATTPLTDGITLKNGQKLLGEGVGLTVGAAALVPAGTRPRVASAGPAVQIAADTADLAGLEVRGLDLAAASTGPVIEASADGGHALGAVISDNAIAGGTSGISMSQVSLTGSTLAIQRNTFANTPTGVSLTQTAGTLTITALDDNTFVAPMSSGIVGTGTITFDAVPGGAIDAVTGGITTMGAPGTPIGMGIQLVTFVGTLSFNTLNIASQGSSAVLVTGQSSLLSGFAVQQGTVSSVSGGGIGLHSLTADVHVTSLTVAGTTGLDLASVDGTVAIASGSIGESIATPVSILGGAANVSYGGTITDSSGPIVAVTGTTGGTKTFSGAISDNGAGTGGGVSLTGNTGATIVFSGGLTLSTGTSPAFTATGGGTVAVCDDNPCAAGNGGIVNRLTTTTGTALRVDATTIGADGLELQSVSSNGAVNGIWLSNTGSTGSLAVKGTGAAGSGGTIQNAGVGVLLTGTRAPSLNWMHLQNATGFGLDALSVADLDVHHLLVDGVNGDAGASTGGSVRLQDLTGSPTIADTTVSGGVLHNISLSQSVSLTRATFSNVTIGANSTGAGLDGINVSVTDGATIGVTVTDSTFTAARRAPFQLSVPAGTADLVFTNNTVSNNHPAILDGGIAINGGSVADPVTVTYTITGNTLRDAVGSALDIEKVAGLGAFSGTIAGNTIGVAAVANSGSSAASGILVQNVGGGSVSASIANNQVYQYNNWGIYVIAGGGGSAQSGTLNVAVNGNTVASPGNAVIGFTVNGFQINGGTQPGDTFAICADIGNTTPNNLTGSGANGFQDFNIRQRQSTTMRLPGYSGGATDNSAVLSFLNARTSVGATGVVSIATGITGGPGSCIP